MADPLDLLSSSAGLDASEPVAGLDLLPPQPGAFKRGLGAGISAVKSSLYGAGALAARAVGAREFEQAALEKAAAESEVAAQGTQTLEQVDWSSPESIRQQFVWLLGNAIPSLGLMAAGGVVGRGLGALAGRARLGTYAGAVAPDVALEAGGIYPAALETGVESPALRAAVGGTVAASLDFLPLLAAERYLRAAGKGGFGALTRGALKGAPVGAMLEGSQELGQAIIERTAAGLPLTGPEALSDYINSFAGGAAPGTLFGAGIGAHRGAAAPAQPLPPVLPPPAAAPPTPLPTPLAGPVLDQRAGDIALLASLGELPATDAPVTAPAPATSLYNRLEAPIALEANRAAMEPLRAQEQTLAQQQEALVAELALPEGKRRSKSAIVKENKAIRTQIGDVRTQIGHLQAEIEAQVARQGTPAEIMPRMRTTPWGVGIEPVADTSAAELAVARQKQEQGQLLSSREATLLRKEAAVSEKRPGLVIPEREQQGRKPREMVKVIPDRERAEVIEGVATESVEKHKKGLAFRAGTEVAATNALNKAVVEASKAPTIDAAEKAIYDAAIKALAGKVNKGDAETFAQSVAKDVRSAPTFYSKAGVQEEYTVREIGTQRKTVIFTTRDKISAQAKLKFLIAQDPEGRYEVETKDVRSAPIVNIGLATNDGTGITVPEVLAALKSTGVMVVKHSVHQSDTEQTVVAQLSRALTPEEAHAVSVATRQEAIAQMVGDKGELYGPGADAWKPFNPSFFLTMEGDRAAASLAAMVPTSVSNLYISGLTYDDFLALPKEEQDKFIDGRYQVLSDAGQKLIERFRDMVGEGVQIHLFDAKPGQPIGSYQAKSGKIKAVVSMALNAKEGLSVADHEGFHAVEDLILDGTEKIIINRAFRDGSPLFEKLLEKVRAYDIANKTNLADEIISVPQERRAYGYEFWKRGELQADTVLGRIFQKIRQFFERVKNYIDKLGFQSLEDIFQAIDLGKYASREKHEGGMVSFASEAAKEETAVQKKFAESKVVDEQGQLLEVYHGTTERRRIKLAPEAAIETRGVIFFSDNQDVAYNFVFPREYGEPVFYDEDGNELEAGRVISAYLNIKNPLVLEEHEAQQASDDTTIQGKVVDQAKREGRDGVIFRDVLEGVGMERSRGTTYGVFDSKQIKQIRGKLHSQAAVDMDRQVKAGELERPQEYLAAAKMIDRAYEQGPDNVFKAAFGALKSELGGDLTRWLKRNILTPNFTSRFSEGFKNVFTVLNTYDRYRSILIKTMLKEKMPAWYDASTADQTAAFKALLDRTVQGISRENLNPLMETLTPQQKTLFTSATKMIEGFLKAELESDKVTYRNLLTTPGEYEKWLADRQAQVDDMIDKGYVPLRRYGDHTVVVIKSIIGKDGRPQDLVVARQGFARSATAEVAGQMYKEEIARSGADLRVEVGYQYKAARDTTVSVQQFIDTARRNGVPLTQQERERIVKALTASDSMMRNRLLRREGTAGYSEDGMRVLNEFGVGMSGKMAYAKFSPAIDAASDGRRVTADIVNSQPQIAVDESINELTGRPNSLWEQEGPQSGFHHNLADELTDYVLVPDHTGGWSRKLRGAAMMYFLGGSISGAMVNTMSVPMLTVPELSLHTNYYNAMATTLAAWKTSWQYQGILRDIVKLKDKDANPIPEIDAVPGLRQALIQASEDGRTMDTEIHQIMGMAQGTMYSQSRSVQRSIEAWMAPFRISEQTNRITSFIAGYKIGLENKLTGRELYNFAGSIVDSTQNNYNECVDVETECLTAAGWKKFSEVQAGDRAYGVTELGTLIETTINKVNIFPGEQEILSFRNGNGFEMWVTENHDCLVQSYSSRDKKWHRLKKRRAGNLKQSDHLLRIPLAGELARKTIYSDDFVELLAWVASEGSYGKVQTPGQLGDVIISQSRSHNPQYVAEIERLLVRLGGHYRRYNNPAKFHPNGRPNNMVKFTVQNPLSWEIRAALPDKQISEELMQRLTVSQMRLFLAAFTKGDGHNPIFGGPTITQKSKNTIDILQMVATLVGVSSTVEDVAGQNWYRIYLAKETKRSHVKALKIKRITVDTVWCPTTDCGTWIARRNGRVFITGNSNRPGAARNPIYALMLMFKSFPLFMTEAAILMYKANPKAAVYMLLGLTMMTGVQGLPFAETIEDIIDTIAQRIFGSPFNSRRAMRNVVKSASEAIVGYDLSGLVLRGVINDIFGMSVSSRIGAGDFVPGSRLGTADADQGRVLESLLGAPFAMVKDVLAEGGKLVGGVLSADWKKSVDALRAGGPVAMRNVIKGTEQLANGYATDSQGRKLIDVTTPEALWQTIGVASAGLARAYEFDRIDRQTNAFYQQVRGDMQNEMVRALKDGDSDRVQNIWDAARAWDEAYSDMPLRLNPGAIRRQLVLSGLRLDERTLKMLPRQLRGTSLSAEGIEGR